MSAENYCLKNAQSAKMSDWSDSVLAAEATKIIIIISIIVVVVVVLGLSYYP